MKAAANQQAVYQQEAADQLAQVEELVLVLEETPGDLEALNRLFRVFHTIKGSGSMFGFEHIAAFAHHLEGILDRVRKGRVRMERKLVDLILSSKDCLGQMLSDPSVPADQALCERVRLYAEGLPSDSDATEPKAPLVSYRIRISLPGDALVRGLDPLRLLQDLRSLGSCQIEAKLDGIPPLEQLDPEQCHFVWSVRLESRCGLNAVKDVFIFVEDDRGIEIVSEVLPEPVLTGTERADVAPKAETPRQGLPSQGPVETSTGEDLVVKVPGSRLDQLVSLVGELVINHSRLRQIAKRQGQPDLNSVSEDLERLLAELRDQTLGIRMTPIGSTFVRFRRLVRDLEAELGKEIDLVCSGEDTEMDKTMLDRLAEPLMHLVRNAVDHGIGTPAQRERQGKPRRGIIRLSASHEGAQVLVRIEDDGRGMDRQAIRARALEKGLIQEGDSHTDEELLRLVFLPGFSTATSVTNLSGRGVGMDIVKRQVESLRGKVLLSSNPGQGTCVTLVLPLTLAIIEGLLVEVGGDSYILPLSLVDENVEICPGECATGNGRNLISVRGELVPFVRLRSLFGFPPGEEGIERVVIVRVHHGRLGLVVDRILGTYQTVVQSLGHFYRELPHISGATILGDGQVALILDAGGLVREIRESRVGQGREASHG